MCQAKQTEGIQAEEQLRKVFSGSQTGMASQGHLQILKFAGSLITKPFLVHYLPAPSGNPKANLQVSLSLRRTQPREGKQVAGVPARALKPKALGQMGSMGTAEQVSVS